jgi:hypothetical protein
VIDRASRFDLLELDGKDMRREPIEHRKSALARLLAKTLPGLQLNEHIAEPGDIVFRHACQLGLEGIVSKRLGSKYRSGHSRDWLKLKNPNAPAVKRETEEDWGKEKARRPPTWQPVCAGPGHQSPYAKARKLLKTIDRSGLRKAQRR